jgi:hypothetical protein
MSRTRGREKKKFVYGSADDTIGDRKGKLKRAFLFSQPKSLATRGKGLIDKQSSPRLGFPVGGKVKGKAEIFSHPFRDDKKTVISLALLKTKV